MVDKLPPHSTENEQAVLGAILLDKIAADKVMGELKGDEFYNKKHEVIFEACRKLYDEGEPIDTISLTNQLKKSKQLQSIGGAYYITGLVENVPTTANIATYIKMVKDKGTLRQLITVGSDIIQMGYDPSMDAIDVLSDSESKIFAISERNIKSGFEHIERSVYVTLDRLDKINQSDGGLTGIPSGLIDLDKKTCGFQDSDLLLVASRPGMGKTSLALTIAQNAEVPTAIFSLEMSRAQLARRVLMASANVDSHKAQQGKLSKEDWSMITLRAPHVAGLPIYIDDTSDMTITEMRSKARRLKSEKGIKLLMVDYLQLMSGEGKGDNRNAEISVITRRMKGMAKELDIPVIVLSQLSRECEKRANKRPILSDLRDSGAIEADADLVIFLYRQGYYEELEGKPITNNKAECIIAKNRNGPTGRVNLAWLREYTRFDNYVEDLFD